LELGRSLAQAVRLNVINDVTYSTPLPRAPSAHRTHAPASCQAVELKHYLPPTAYNFLATLLRLKLDKSASGLAMERRALGAPGELTRADIK
jgi:hypothetical protein